MAETSNNMLPQPTGWDRANLAVKVALSALPVAGSPAAELFAAIIAPPLVRRRDEWLQSLADGIGVLSEKIAGFAPEVLANNEAFVSVAMQASRAALQTHQKEKLEALRNAVLNVAAGQTLDDDEQVMFLWCIETLTTWHVHILKFLEAPMRMAAARGARTEYSILSGCDLTRPLEESFPELRGHRDFYDQIVRDLHARGFLDSTPDVLHEVMNDAGMAIRRTTKMAGRFLAFIAPPA
jgi:hypothetical protein